MPFSSRSLRRHIKKYMHEGAFVDKLMHKVNDVRTSAANIAARLGADSPTRSWTVIGLMVTVTPEPAAYVQGVEVPFCTIDQLADVVLSDTLPKSGAVPR